MLMHTLTRLAFRHSYGTQQLEQVFLLILFHLEEESHLTLSEMFYSSEPTQTLHLKSEFDPICLCPQSQQFSNNKMAASASHSIQPLLTTIISFFPTCHQWKSSPHLELSI